VRAQADAAPLRAFVIGFNVLFIGLVVLAGLTKVAERAPVLWLPVLVLLAALLIAASFGLSAFAQKVGEALQPHATPLRQSVAGAVLLYWACLLPGIGWLLPRRCGFFAPEQLKSFEHARSEGPLHATRCTCNQHVSGSSSAVITNNTTIMAWLHSNSHLLSRWRRCCSRSQPAAIRPRRLRYPAPPGD
jgi:hypothetical protein